MTSAHLRLSRVSTAIASAIAIAAFGASSAAATDALRLLAAVSHAVPSADRDKEKWIEIGSVQWGAARTGSPDRPLVAGRIPNAGVEREMKESGEKGGTEDINIGVGELQEMTISKSMDRSSASIAKDRPMTWDNTKQKKASGRATPMLRQGSVTTLVPAGTCRLGARYPAAELATGQRVYTMTNVVVAGCTASFSGHGGDSNVRPMESMSLNYERIVWK